MFRLQAFRAPGLDSKKLDFKMYGFEALQLSGVPGFEALALDACLWPRCIRLTSAVSVRPSFKPKCFTPSP